MGGGGVWRRDERKEGKTIAYCPDKKDVSDLKSLAAETDEAALSDGRSGRGRLERVGRDEEDKAVVY